jgi:hypothetical protein
VRCRRWPVRQGGGWASRGGRRERLTWSPCLIPLLLGTFTFTASCWAFRRTRSQIYLCASTFFSLELKILLNYVYWKRVMMSRSSILACKEEFPFTTVQIYTFAYYIWFLNTLYTTQIFNWISLTKCRSLYSLPSRAGRRLWCRHRPTCKNECTPCWSCRHDHEADPFCSRCLNSFFKNICLNS